MIPDPSSQQRTSYRFAEKVTLDPSHTWAWMNESVLKAITHIPVARTNNIGDDIQSLAASRLFNVQEYVHRDRPEDWPADAVIPLCGWFGWGDLPSKAQAVIVGYHCAERSRSNVTENARWFRDMVREQGFPAMCRDLATRDFLRSLGVDAEFGGCVTLTLPRYEGARTGGHLVIDDLRTPRHLRNPTLSQLQRSQLTLRPRARLEIAALRLELLSLASFVETSRLHVFLPCAALGTPVRLNLTSRVPEQCRFSGYLSQI